MTEELRAEVAAERREQVELLERLTPQQWDAPSLCEGWRVREVIAHTTLAYRMKPGRFFLELIKAGGRFNPMSDKLARRDAAVMSTDDLIRALRDNIDHPWTPPGGGVVGALSHDVIHGLDITVALGHPREVPLHRLVPIMKDMSPKHVKYFGADLSGVELQATDLDWRMGDGTPIKGKAQDLLLVVCGRRLPAGRLEGEATRFER